MQRPLWLRLTVAVWAIWLGAVLAGPPGLHACPVHGNHAGHHMAGMDAAMADMPGAPAHTAQHDAPAQHSESHCTCVGACCSAVPVTPPTAQVAEITVDVPVAVAPIAPLRDNRATTAAPPHALPFANAPPIAA
jgi:hypothetical protein